MDEAQCIKNACQEVDDLLAGRTRHLNPSTAGQNVVIMQHGSLPEIGACTNSVY